MASSQKVLNLREFGWDMEKEEERKAAKLVFTALF
jgi:hypothetical protein